MENWPSLELTFAEDGEHPLLIDAAFCLHEGVKAANKTILHQPPRGKYFRSLCILMLLAKYRGESFADENGIIWFQDSVNRLTWIKALGTSFWKETQLKFFQEYFQNCNFLSASRGSGHNAKNRKNGSGVLPAAKYHTKQLSLQNLRFYQNGRGAAKELRKLIDGEELARFAELLEQFEVEKPEGWQPVVAALIADTRQDRPRPVKPKAAKLPTRRNAESRSQVFSARWRELFLQVRDEIKTREDKAGDWYAVALVPRWLADWNEILCEAVTRHKARVRIAYHAPSAAEKSAAVKAQWRMNSSSIHPTELDVVELIPKRLARMKEEMGGWATAATKVPAAIAGTFEFFESYITHPFMGLMYVPPGTERLSRLAAGAPPGTWCLLSFYPFYQTSYDVRCGLYLTDPGPVLDVYYNSILDLFERGPKDGYLKPVNLAKTAPRKKR